LARLVLQKAIVFFLQGTLRPQRFFPGLLQATGHETILGLDRVTLPFGALGLMDCALQTLCPMAVQAFPFLVNIAHRLETQLQGSRLQRTQELLANQVIHRRGAEPPERLSRNEGVKERAPRFRVDVAKLLSLPKEHAREVFSIALRRHDRFGSQRF
jgi:hypothetical protein